MHNSLPDSINVRINYVKEAMPERRLKGEIFNVKLDKYWINSIATIATHISKSIGLEGDSSLSENSQAKLYSQDGIELNDNDLYFLDNYGVLYLDIYGHPFNYQQILFQYNIGEKIGSGSFGVVYKIIDKITMKEYAMKMVKVKDFFNRASTAENLFREQKVLMHLNHTHIVKLHNSFIVKDKIWQIMELCAGGDLK